MTPLEFIAHDIICIVKFNATGGTATKNEIKRVCEYLTRLGKLPPPEPVLPRVAVTIPKINGLPVVVMHNPATAPRVSIPLPSVAIGFRKP